MSQKSTLFAVDSFKGLRTDTTADKIGDGYLAKAENIRLLPDGGFGIRPGHEIVATWDPNTGLPILNLHVMEELNVLICQSGTKLFVAKDENSSLYDIGLTLTVNRCDLEEYDASVKYSNGTDAYGSIAFALVKTQFTNSDTRIYLGDGYAPKFSASGTVYCKGQAIPYTKKLSSDTAVTFTATNATETFNATAHGLVDGDTLRVSNTGGALPQGLTAGKLYYVVSAAADTFKLSLTAGGSVVTISDDGSGTNKFTPNVDVLLGCTVPSGTYEVGHVITQTSTKEAAPLATVLESQFEKMMASGVSPARHAIYYSATASTTNPTYIDDFSANGASQELYGKYGKVTAMKSLLTKLYVAKDKGIETWTGIDSNAIPIRAPFTDAYGVVNNQCLIVVGDKLALFTGRRFKTIEPDSTGADPNPVINPYFDQKIKGTLALLDADQSGACMGYGQDELIRGTVLVDDVRNTIIYDALAKGFSIDTGITPSCWVEYRGSVYIGSSTDDVIYKSETGYTDGGVAPAMDVLSPIHYVGDRRRKVPVKEIYLTGIIKEGTTATVTIYCDGAERRVLTLDGSASYVNTSSARPFGRSYLGLDPFGLSGGEDDASGYYFSVPIAVNLDCRHIQLRFQCQGTGYRVQINSYEGVRGEGAGTEFTQEESF